MNADNYDGDDKNDDDGVGNDDEQCQYQ